MARLRCVLVLASAAYYPLRDESMRSGGDEALIETGSDAYVTAQARECTEEPCPEDNSENVDWLKTQIARAKQKHNAMASSTKAKADTGLAKIQTIADESLAVVDAVAIATNQLSKSQENVDVAYIKAKGEHDRVTTEERLTSHAQNEDRRLVEEAAQNAIRTLTVSAFNDVQSFKMQAAKSSNGVLMNVKADKYKSDNAVEKTRLSVHEANKVEDTRLKAFQSITGAMPKRQAEMVDDRRDEINRLADVQSAGQTAVKKAQYRVKKALAKVDTTPLRTKDMEDEAKDAKDDLEDGMDKGADEVEEMLDAGQDNTKDLTKELKKAVGKTVKSFEREVKKAAKLREKATYGQQHEARDLVKGVQKIHVAVLNNAKNIAESKSAFEDLRSAKQTQTQEDVDEMLVTGQNADNTIAKHLEDRLANDATNARNANIRTAGQLADAAQGEMDHLAETMSEEIMESTQKLYDLGQAVDRSQFTAEDLGHAAVHETAKLDADTLLAAGFQHASTEQSKQAVFTVESGAETVGQQMKTQVDHAVDKMGSINSEYEGKMMDAVTELNEPVQAKASAEKLRVSSQVAEKQQDLEHELRTVEGKFAAIQSQMVSVGAGHGQHSEEQAVLDVIDALVTDMTLEQTRVQHFDGAKLSEKESVLKEADAGAGAVHEAGHLEKQALIHSLGSQITRFEDKLFTGDASSITSQTQAVAAARALVTTSQHDVEDKISYANERLGSWDKVFSDEQVRVQEETGSLKAHVADIYNQGFEDLKSTVSSSVENAKSAVNMAVTATKNKEETVLYNTKQNLLKSAAILKKQGMSGLTITEAELHQLFESQSKAEAAKLAAVEEGAEEVSEEAGSATQLRTEALQDTEDQASNSSNAAVLAGAQAFSTSNTLVQEAATIGDTLETLLERGNEQVNDMTNNDAVAREHSLAIGVDGSTEGLGQRVEEVGNVMAEAATDTNLEEQAVLAEADEVNKDEKDADRVARGAAEAAQVSVDDADDRLSNNGANFDKAEKEEAAAEGGAALAEGKLIGEIESAGEDLETKSEHEANTLEQETDADAKATAGEIKTMYSAGSMIEENAKQKLKEGKLELDTQRGSIESNINNLKEAMRMKAVTATAELGLIKKLTDSEYGNLEANAVFLHNYDIQTQSQLLELLGGSVDPGGPPGMEQTIGLAAEHTGGLLDEVVNAEADVASRIGGVLGSQAFQDLQSVMDAETAVDTATIENLASTTYFTNAATELGEEWKSQIALLEEAQYAILLHENEEKDEQIAATADEGVLADNVIASISAMLDNYGSGGGGAELTESADASIAQLTAMASSGSAADKTLIAHILSRIDLGGKTAEEQLTLFQGIMDTVNAKVMTVQKTFEEMQADLRELVEFQERLTSDELKRMEARLGALSDQVFYGGEDWVDIRTPPEFRSVSAADRKSYMDQARASVDAAYKRGSAATTTLLQQTAKHGPDAKVRAAVARAKRLQSLLTQNEQLTKTNKGLDAKHTHLGALVEAEASKRLEAS